MLFQEGKEFSIKEVLDGQRKLENCRSEYCAKAILQSLCGDNEKLCDAIVDFYPQLLSVSDDIPTREDLEKLYICIVGIDFIIDIDKKYGDTCNKRYQNTLNALRSLRGKEIYTTASALHDEDGGQNYICGLSKYAQEDFVSYATATKNLGKVNQDIINSL